MLVRYSIVELLMVFEVSAQREHTIVLLLSSKYLSTNPEQSCYVNYSLVTLLLQAVASSI